MLNAMYVCMFQSNWFTFHFDSNDNDDKLKTALKFQRVRAGVCVCTLIKAIPCDAMACFVSLCLVSFLVRLI